VIFERMHRVDERIGIREYAAAIRTYRELIIEARIAIERRARLRTGHLNSRLYKLLLVRTTFSPPSSNARD
jgi:hypothetical protein